MDRSSESLSKIKQWHDPFLLIICRLITSAPHVWQKLSLRFSDLNKGNRVFRELGHIGNAYT